METNGTKTGVTPASDSPFPELQKVTSTLPLANLEFGVALDWFYTADPGKLDPYR